ncbi:MAG TPA: aldehyde dehydrogenase family protein [Candidatus Cybelea sp.]|nr:aldehyde dehydrogenase family protein [Candidatus Cybelea sp.]
MALNAIVEELLAGEKRQTGQADMMLEAAGWAAASFAQFDHARVDAIVRAAAEAGFAVAGPLAEAAVKETGFGVAAHKKIKNELTSRGLYETYRGDDFCSKRVLADKRIVELPRPAGVVFALTPSTNPVCTVFFKIMLALMTRNAVVISPHPMAKACSADAAKVMAKAAEKAGAPSGVIQVVEQPSLPLIDHIMKSPKVNVILATGGTPMVRAAYSSGNPAIGVGPGNAPALVDATADIEAAAKRIVDSKSFDNSILCTNESVVVAEASIADRLVAALRHSGAHVAKPEEVAQLRDLIYGKGSFNVEVLGKSAAEIGQKAGIRVPANARIILAEIDRVGIDEPLSKEKLCPVLGFIRAPHVDAAITISRALIRMSGAGHSAAIHSKNPATVLKFSAAVKALRVAVNVPCSQGAAGFGTHLAPSFTIGTGFFGRSAIGENIEPKHLVNWTRIAYSDEADAGFGDFGALEPTHGLPEPILGATAPMSLGRLQEGAAAAPASATNDEIALLREEIRRIVLDELRHALRK